MASESESGVERDEKTEKKSSRSRETESKRRRPRRRSRKLESKKLEHRRRIRKSESGVGAEKIENPETEFEKLKLWSRSQELESIKHGTSSPSQKN